MGTPREGTALQLAPSWTRLRALQHDSRSLRSYWYCALIRAGFYRSVSSLRNDSSKYRSACSSAFHQSATITHSEMAWFGHDARARLPRPEADRCAAHERTHTEQSARAATRRIGGHDRGADPCTPRVSNDARDAATRHVC